MNGDMISSSKCQPNESKWLTLFWRFIPINMGKDLAQESPSWVFSLPSAPSSSMLCLQELRKREKKRNNLHSHFVKEKSINGQEAPVAPS